MSVRSPRALLALAAVAVCFAAADTYVVVLALPDMMASTGLSIDQLQRAAPIVSGFLLGYVAMLPLIGRIADIRGRLPVLSAGLVLFAFGSLVTAASYDLPSLVAGRFLQGVGGGGLVPVTLALVADVYPAERRGVPLGVVGAVQELGSVLGPLYGALVLAVADWRAIFWLNLAVGLVLAAAIRTIRGQRERPVTRPDWLGLALFLVFVGALLLVMRQPTSLTTSVRWGWPFVPFGGHGPVWWSPVGLVTIGLGLAWVAWLVLAVRLGRHSLVDLPAWGAALRRADLLGALLLGIALAGVILAFATADPQVQVLSPIGPWCVGAAAVSLALFVRHTRRKPDALVPRGALVARPAWGAVLVSFFIGSALIAALVDIPVFARVTVYGDSQTKAALVLVEFLVALPVGAVGGGFATRRVAAGAVTAAGMVLAAVGFVLMAGWGPLALEHASSSVVLALTGLGFGLALAPVNAALLASTSAEVHGVASALLVVGRMIGMLVGISALTTIGLRRYYAVEGTFPSLQKLCGGPQVCKAYDDLVQQAGIEQLHAIFVGAVVCAVVAGLLALVTFQGAATRSASTAEILRTV